MTVSILLIIFSISWLVAAVWIFEAYTSIIRRALVKLIRSNGIFIFFATAELIAETKLNVRKAIYISFSIMAGVFALINSSFSVCLS